MARVYRDLVKKGLRTIESIPEKYRKEVQTLLEESEV